MIKIAIETTDGFSISIDDNGTLHDHAATDDAANRTSELLWRHLSDIDNKSDIREIYLSSGPANYTNLRIIYAFAMGVRRATGAAIYTIPSFLAKASFLIKSGHNPPFVLVNYARNREYSYQIIDNENVGDIDWHNINLAAKEDIMELSQRYKCVTNQQTYETLGLGEVVHLKAPYLFGIDDKYKKDNGLIYARASV